MRALGLAEALARADAHPDVVVARAEEAVARAGVAVASSRPDVTIGFATHSITARASAAIAVPVRWLGQRRLAVAAAVAGADAAMLSIDEARAAARQEVRAAWLGLAAAQGRAEALAARASHLEDAAHAVSEMVDAGRVARLDYVRARAEQVLAQDDALAADAERLAASATLSVLLGEDASVPVRATGAADVAITAPETAAGAIPDTPAWRAQQARLRAADAAIAQAEAESRPGLQLSAGADAGDPTQPGVDASVGVDVVVRPGGKARRALAVAERGREEAEAARLKATLARRLAEASRREDAARLRLSALDEAASAAREASGMARVAYDAGRGDMLQLLDAERLLAEAERDRWDAWLELQLAASERAWLMGEPLPQAPR